MSADAGTPFALDGCEPIFDAHGLIFDDIARAVIETCPQCDSDLGAGVMWAYATGRTFVPGTTCPECPGADKDPVDPEAAAQRRAAKADRAARGLTPIIRRRRTRSDKGVKRGARK